MANSTVHVKRAESVIWTNETIGNLSVEIVPGPHQLTLTVRYYTQEGTAHMGFIEENQGAFADGFEGDDFVYVEGILTWEPNDRIPQTVNITIIDDDDWESDECFYFILAHSNETITQIYDNTTICIYGNDTPQDCMQFDWSEWTECSVEFGNGKQTRYKHKGSKDAEGIMHCETVTETKECVGKIKSLTDKPMIKVSKTTINISAHWDKFFPKMNFTQSETVQFKITSMPVANPNITMANVTMIDGEALIQITLVLSPLAEEWIEFEPAILFFRPQEFCPII